MAIQDDIVNMEFRNRLFLEHVPNPRRVLDCGYGQAHWAIKVAEQYPDCDVTYARLS